MVDDEPTACSHCRWGNCGPGCVRSTVKVRELITPLLSNGVAASGILQSVLGPLVQRKMLRNWRGCSR